MINTDDLIKIARLNRDSVALKSYQNLKTEFVRFEKGKGNILDPSSQIQILAKYCKKLEDSISEFSKASREDLVSEYRDELEILQKLLPVPVSASDIYEELRYWADKNGYINDEIASEIQIPKKEMGVAIKFIKSKLPTADGKMISEVVKENLA